MAALSAVYFSSPRKHLPVAPNTTTCSPELGFFLDNYYMSIGPIAGVGTGDPPLPRHQFLFCGSGFATFGVDLAYDGNQYGIMADPCDSTTPNFWGRLDPYGTVGDATQPGMVRIGLLPFVETAHLARPAFLPEVPDPGAPIGYRLGGRPVVGQPNCPDNPTTTSNGIILQCAVDLYAVDSLSPYREHLVAAHLDPGGAPTPDRYNFALGTSVVIAPGTGSQESRTNVFLTTTDSIYCYGAGPVCPNTVNTGKMTQVGYLSLFKISRNTTLGSSRTPGYYYIADGGAVFVVGVTDYATDPTIAVQDSFFVKPLTQIVGMGRLNCARGGVHFDPDTRIYTSEAGGSSTFTAALTAAPTADVTMTLTSSNTAEGTVSPASLTFTTANWSTPQTVTVTGVLNPSAVGPQSYTVVTGDLSSTDPNYDGMVIRDLAATNFKGAGPTLNLHSPMNLQPGSLLDTTIADVSDGEDPAGSLPVTIGTNFEVDTIGSPVNTNGAVTALLTVPCYSRSNNPYARFWPVSVADSAGNQRSDQFSLVVGPPTPPVLSYANTKVAAGGGKTILPVSYDGATSSIDASSPTFTGTLSTSNTTGALTVGNAGPPGDHTINLTAGNRCNGALVTNTSFTLHVNAPPSITPVGTAVQQGSPSMTATLATVSDAETAAGSLSVTTVTAPSGVTVGTLTNTNGTITAPVSASCSAITGPRTLTLRVTDADGATTDADVTINVNPNTPPTLGTYASTEVKSGDPGLVTPSAPPSDNGSATLTLSGYPGSISVNSTSGVVTISNAGPVGNYTVTVTATDNCSAVTTATFPLSVYNCSYTIAPAFANFSSPAASGSVMVTAKPGCSWTASAPNGSFVSITAGASGTGNGTVSYDVASNTATTARSTTLTIAGQSFTVTQSAAGAGTFSMTAAASPAQVAISWGPVSGATSYEVHRNDGVVVPTATLAYNDTSISAGTGYVYRVYAFGSGGLIAYSNADLAVPFVYANSTLSIIRAVDFVELQQGINAARAALGWPAMIFNSIAPGMVVQASDLTSLRTALDAVRAAVAAGPMSYTDPAVSPQSTVIRAAHVGEIRNGLR